MLIRECTRDDTSFSKMLDLYVDLARQAAHKSQDHLDKQSLLPLEKKEEVLIEKGGAEMPMIGVIDDSPSLNDIVKRVLQHEGYRVHCWLSPLELLEGKEEIPSLILLDIEMPEMNGAVAMDRFKADPRFARTKIIFMTGLVSQQEATELSLPGKTAYLSKPFTKEKLVELVKKSLETSVHPLAHPIP